MVQHIDLLLERYIINKYISMPKLFDSLGIDYRVNANMYCPFHRNENTPSAHLYHDEIGYRLWCFSENRMYGAWNVYKAFISNINTNQLALMIFNRLSEDDQKNLLNELGTESEPDTLPYQKELDKFKKHQISIDDLLSAIANSYIDKA